jgi:hypothetical protein
MLGNASATTRESTFIACIGRIVPRQNTTRYTALAPHRFKNFFEIEEAAGALAITPLNSPSGIWFQIKRSAPANTFGACSARRSPSP